MLITSSNDHSRAFPSELIQFSSHVEELKLKQRSPIFSAINKSLEPSHAAPIMPLQDRDLLEMAKLFDRKDADAIEADIDRVLLMLSPEPCWEEESDLWREFL